MLIAFPAFDVCCVLYGHALSLAVSASQCIVCLSLLFALLWDHVAPCTPHGCACGAKSILQLLRRSVYSCSCTKLLLGQRGSMRYFTTASAAAKLLICEQHCSVRHSLLLCKSCCWWAAALVGTPGPSQCMHVAECALHRILVSLVAHNVLAACLVECGLPCATLVSLWCRSVSLRCHL